MKKPKLTTMPDFVVQHVDKVLSDAQAVIGQNAGRVPALRYFRHGKEFSLPINYDYFVNIGNKIKGPTGAAVYIERMGPEFAFLAMEIAERSENPVWRLEDQLDFLGHVGHTLYHVAPQAFFVSMAVKIISHTSELERLIGLVLGGVPQPPEPNALLVMGCNQVRSYTVVTEFSDGKGRVKYSKPKIFDSLKGHNHADALFTGIYEPSRN